MAIAFLTLNGNDHSYSDIARGHFGTTDIYEKAVLEFCRQWLSGQTAFSVHTSGSTGKPKPIKVTRKQMVASAHMTAGALGLKKEDQALVCINTQYIGGKMMLVRGLEIGMQMTIIAPVSNPLEHIPPAHTFDFTALVPLQLQTILEQPGDKLHLLNGMKAVIVGGAVVSSRLHRMVQQLACPVYATYGMTETVSHIALRRLNNEVSDLYTVFDEVKIGQDHRDCLTVQSILTNHRTLVTNDRVKITGPRTFEWLGRIDNVINSGGIKFQVEQIETEITALFEHLHINKRFFITGIKDEALGEKMVLVIEGTPFPGPEENEITRLLRARMHKHAVPRSFYYLPRFIETESGKVSRRQSLKSANLM